MKSYQCSGSLVTVTLLFVGSFFCLGCAKVEDAAKSAAESAKQAVANQMDGKSPKANASGQSKAPDASAPQAAPPRVDQERVLSSILALKGAEITDEKLAALAALDASHRESVLSLDLTESPVTAEGVKQLAALPNLTELIAPSLAPEGVAALGDLSSIRVLSLNYAGSLTDADLPALTKLPNLERLLLRSVQVSDEGLKTIAQMKSLKYVDLGNNGLITGPGLAALAGMESLEGIGLNANAGRPDLGVGILALAKIRQLKELDISTCQVTDSNLAVLKSWPELRSLFCNNNPITDSAMVFIKPLNLVDLDLRNTQITEQGVNQIGSRQLQRLWLSVMTDQAMPVLKRFPDLRELYVAGAAISDVGIVQLKGLKNLRILDISKTQVGDRGLGSLTGLRSLRSIYLEGTSVTPAGVDALRDALPDLTVVDAGE